MSQISFTIPNDPKYLKAVSKMLMELTESPVFTKEEISEVKTYENEKPLEPAPVAETPFTQPAVDLSELDSKGLPWDERIHASTKSKVSNGEWKKKRGVDDALVQQVEAELFAAVGTPTQDAPPVTQTQDAPPPPPPVTQTQDAPPPPPPETKQIESFGELVEMIQSKGLDFERVGKTIITVTGGQVQSLPLLATRPEFIPAVAQSLQS